MKSILIFFDDTIFRLLVKFIYPQYKRQRKGYSYNFNIIRRYVFMQKIIGFNRNVPWPVDFRSQILGFEHIKKGIMCQTHYSYSLNKLKPFKKLIKNQKLINSENWARECLSLPLHPEMKKIQINKIISEVKRFFKN